MPQWSNREVAGTLQALVIDAQSLTKLDAQELRDMVSGLLEQIAQHTQTITACDTTITAKERDILYRQTKMAKCAPPPTIGHFVKLPAQLRTGEAIRLPLSTCQCALRNRGKARHRWPCAPASPTLPGSLRLRARA